MSKLDNQNCFFMTSSGEIADLLFNRSKHDESESVQIADVDIMQD